MRAGSKTSVTSTPSMDSGPSSSQARTEQEESREKPKGIRRSLMLMDSLYKVRRVGFVEDGEGEGSEDVLMIKTLGDMEDSAESLAKVESRILDAQELLPAFGGSRHASAILSARTLAIVRRKRQRLQKLESRMDDFKRVQARAEQVLQQLKEDGSMGLPPELAGLGKFAASHVHKSGDPARSNKSDFETFVNSFGLPQGHFSLRRIEAAGSEATRWWAHVALREAKAGTDNSTVHRILNVAHSILGNPDHEAIKSIRNELLDTIADNTLSCAQALQEKDKKVVMLSIKSQPESAAEAGDAITEAIRSAVGMGVMPMHRSLKEAKDIAVRLHDEEKERLARKVLEYAVEQKEKDEAMAMTSDGVPAVGPAAHAAENIQVEIDKAVEKGVRSGNPLLKDARNIASNLRNEDTVRKRLAARELRNFRG